MTLLVFLEVMGKDILVGRIMGTSSEDACFAYDEEYMSVPEHRPISIALPFTDEPYSPAKTKCFFDGLLPEGYTRRCVAGELHVDEQDYISLLEILGDECLGAIRILNEEAETPSASYKELSVEQLKRFALEGSEESAVLVTKSHLSLTGASGKTGLYYSEADDKWYMPVGSAPSTHIVKQSHVRLGRIVANEQLSLLTASKLGIQIPESFVVSFDGVDSKHALFATKRYDRKQGNGKLIDGLQAPYRLHQEDFAQALGIQASFKYEKSGGNYLEKMMRLLMNYSSNPIEDQLRLWDICLFNYFLGNTDNHIKNLSLLYSEDMKKIRLSPAYDLVSTLVYESSTDEMALGIDGVYKISNITRDSFKREAAKDGLGVGIAMAHFDHMRSEFENALLTSAEELISQGIKDVSYVADDILHVFRSRFK